MVNRQLYKYFKDAHKLSRGPAAAWLKQTDSDSHLFPQAKENSILRIIYDIPVEEEIIFKRDTSKWNVNNQGIVITDVSIYVHYDNNCPEDFFYLDWEDISSVKYKDEVFYFYEYDEDESFWQLGSELFFKGSYTESDKKNLARFLSKAAILVEQRVDAIDHIIQLEEDEKYDEALQALSELTPEDLQNPWNNLVYGRVVTRKLSTLGEPNEELFRLANEKLNKALELVDDEERHDMFWCTSYWHGCNYLSVNQQFNARNCFINALETDEEGMKMDALKRLDSCEKLLKDIWDNYLTTYEYIDRKYIMPVRDHQIAGCTATDIDTFRMSNIPSCIKFPVGHPVANELYIGHPYKPELYVPYVGHEDVFFIDKIHELSYILQCLGAEEISITAIKGKTVTEIEKSSSSLGGNVDFAFISGSADVNSNANSRQSTQSNVERTLVQRFDPLKKPFVPEGLIWYPEQPKWQRLVESRLNGNMLEYSEFVSTFDTSFTSTTETDIIKASVQYLWNKLDANASSKIEKEFEQKIETQWRVDVKFRSMLEFDQPVSDAPKALIANEQKYLDLVKKSCANGEISDLNRKMLEIIRNKLGISEERASELEASLIPQLSEEEKEYLDAVREYLADGTIGANEREMLKTLCELNNISEERAKELEAMV